MRIIIFLAFLTVCSIGYGQQDDKISTIDFVQILNDNKEEATYYYQNNWKVLRIMAINKRYIYSFQILEMPKNEDQPFQLMLITTYLDGEQYKLREDHFTELIKEKGALKLMNDKQPVDFRKVLFNKKMVRHWK